MKVFQLNKYYVVSGQLRRLVTASGPMAAAMQALEMSRGGDTLDAHYFYVDERGFRDYGSECDIDGVFRLVAEHWLKTDDVLKANGMVDCDDEPNNDFTGM